MAKNTSLKIHIFLLLTLLCFIKSDDDDVKWLDYYQGKGFFEKMTEYPNVKKFAVQFKDGYDGPFYMKIEVTTEEGKEAPLLCFSNTESSCENKQILVRNLVGNSVFFWVKKEQFEAEGLEPYFLVTCPGEGSCKYSIRGSDSENTYATFYPNFVYSYLVTKKNQKMQFKLLNQTSFDNSHRFVICIDGSTTAKLNLDAAYNPYDLGTIHCVDFAAALHDENWGMFTITGALEEEYITISVHYYKLTGDQVNLGRSVEGFATINGPVVTSMISGDAQEECFPIKKEDFQQSSSDLYIVGKIHTKYAWFFFEKEDGTFIEETDHEVIDGQLAFPFKKPSSNEFRYVCFERPSDEFFTQMTLIFSFQIIDYGKLKQKSFTYTEPMLSGQFYRRLLPKGYVDFYHVGKLDGSAKKFDYTLSNIKGEAKLYIAECTTFPFCKYSEEDLPMLNNTIISHANNHMIYGTDYGDSTPIGFIKDAMVVQCEDTNLNGDYCEFDVSVFSRGQDVELIENQKLYKYVMKGEKGNLLANLKVNRVVTRLTIDIMVFNGDVSFSIKENDLNVQKYYLSNKITFNVIKPQEVLDKVTIEFEANLNSFFNIQYSVDSQRSEQTEEILFSGESYIVQVNPLSLSKTKTIKMSNLFENRSPFLINFFAINCEFEVKRGKTEIPFSDGYAQEYLDKGQLVDNYYTYNVKITQQDSSNYNNKMCFLYVAGVEVDDKINREIVVAENINQQIIFDDKFKKIRFTYPFVDRQKDLTYHINVIDKAHYKINGYLNGQKIIDNLQIAVTSTYFLYSEEFQLNCKDEQICSLSLDVEVEKEIVKTNPMIEITFREIKNVPTYLQKGNAKLDYVCGDKLYYLYTDLGRNDFGEITLNFLREFGQLWAKVVKKDLQTPEPEANWRKYYRMPGPDWEDSLPFDSYTKKLKITSKDTESCINGCYLLMTIKINEIGGYVSDSIFYPFSILVKVTPPNKAYTEIPKLVIQVDEYIVGTLDVTEMDERYISEFYEIWLPHDSDTVEFDWQSSLAGLYISIGGTRPTTKNADFVLTPPGRASLISLEKNQILQVAKKKGVIEQDVNSLQDINMVIGVWTNKTDSINNELYSLRVHQNIANEEEDLGIIEVNSDQKVICKPRSARDGYTTIYRCLFMISYISDESINSPLYIHGYSSDLSSNVDLFGSFIDREIYNSYEIAKIKEAIPTRQTAEYNTNFEDVKYIHIKKLYKDKYFFVNLYTDVQADLTLINSLPIIDSNKEKTIFQVFPNSHTEQLFACGKEQLQIVFPGEDDSISTTIEVVSGEAEINWKEDPDTFYKVKGFQDRLNLFSDKNQRNLMVKNKTAFKNDTEERRMIEDPGFLFYVTYKARKTGVNFDEIPFQKSTEISYTNTDLPVILYCKLWKVYKDINIAIQFKDISTQTEGAYSESPIIIRSTIMKEDTIYSAKKNSETDMVPSKDKSVFGYYDPAIKTALIYLSKAKINSYNIKPTENPTLYLRVEKSSSYQETNFSKFNIEAQVAGVNDKVIPVEKVYHYGKLGSEKSAFYILKIQKNKIYMRVQIAFNGPDLDFTIHQEQNNWKKNQTYSEYKSFRERGKVYITFEQPDLEYIYLNIFRKSDNTKVNEQLTNYVFKYITADTQEEFFDYTMKSPLINCSVTPIKNNEDMSNVECTFDKINSDNGDIDVTYFLKIVENSTYIYGEEMATIAVTESPNQVFFKRNPATVEDDKIKLSGEGSFSNWGYINVIAQVQQNNIVEFVAYNGKMEIKPDPNKKEGDDDKDEGSNNTVLFGVIGGVLGAIVIGLIVIIVIFQIRNKSLMNKVKHVSFQKTNAVTDPNLLLQKQNDGINNSSEAYL